MLTVVTFRVTFTKRNIINLFSAVTVFSVSDTEPVKNTWTKALQKLCCQIEVSFIVESFLIGKPWSSQQIHVRSLELPSYIIMLMSSLRDNQIPL